MSIVKIVVADAVYAGTISAESQEEREEKAEELAGLRSSAASEWLSAQYPEAEVCADVAIYKGSGPARPLEVFAYDEKEALDEALSKTLQAGLTEELTRVLREG